LDGLEAVELKLSEVLEDNITFRFDSRYVNKEYLKAYLYLKSKEYNLNSKISLIKSGSTPRDRDETLKQGTILLKTNDIRNNILSDEKDDFFYIDENTNKKMKSTQLKTGDVLMNIVGATTDVIGRSSLILDNFPSGNITQAMAFSRIINNNFLPEYLFILFQTYYGQIQVKRLARPTGQYNLNLDEVGRFIIPNRSLDFQLKIKELVISSHQKLEESKKLYKQSEELLLKELDLLDFVQSKEKVAIKTFSESLGESGRLDSEYYQPKYNQIIDAIKKIDYENLHNLVNLNKSIEPGSDAYQDMGIPFIRVSNLTKFGLSEPSIHLSENLFDNEVLEKLQPKKDTILLSKDGTVGIAYNIKKDTNIITSGAILHLTLKDNRVLPEYLTLVLNSLVVQMQSQRDAGGSIIKHWKPSEIGEVLIPIINNLIQTKIEEKIKESFKLKEESKQLLEVAKRAVEIAIEDSEDVAMEFIDEKV